MLTGVSYMGHHSSKHLRTDLQDIKSLGCDDVLLAVQEDDLRYRPGKLRFTAEICGELGLRPIAILWGALNLFGGGKQSQHLLEHPEGHQVRADGSHGPQGCYVNPGCVRAIKEAVDRFAEESFAGYFIDEPTELDCYCPSCRARFEEYYGGDLTAAGDAQARQFRQRCVIDYIESIAGHCKANHPRIETMCCVMPCDQSLWEKAAGIRSLDNLGTDIYWVNDDRPVEESAPIIRELGRLCTAAGKQHHQWLQSWKVKTGQEKRIEEQGDVFIREAPDALYVWAYESQIGTYETSADPVASWEATKKILRKAKGLD